MSGPPEREGYRHLSTAVDRFRVDGRSEFVWSVVAAAALHVLAFFGTPTWRGAFRTFESEPWQGVIEWVVLSFPSVGTAEVATPEPGGGGSGGEIDVGADAGRGDEPQLSVGEIAGLSDALREVLLAPALVPSLVQPEPSQGSAALATGSGSVVVEGGGASAVMLEGLDAADSLALELLSSLRPELVVLNPSTWILIRNPSVVENFMRTRASNLPDLNGSRRSTSVALWIDETGSVEWAEISQSSGRTDLDELALELFSEVATFRPARDRGVRVPTTAIFTVHFPW